MPKGEKADFEQKWQAGRSFELQQDDVQGGETLVYATLLGSLHSL